MSETETIKVNIIDNGAYSIKIGKSDDEEARYVLKYKRFQFLKH